MNKKKCDYEAYGQTLIIHLPEELDHCTCLPLRYETDLLLEENYIRRLVFDFSHTGFMDSSGIGVLLSRYKQVAGSGGSAVIYGADERIRRLLRIGGISRLMRQYATREEALDEKQ